MRLTIRMIAAALLAGAAAMLPAIEAGAIIDRPGIPFSEHRSYDGLTMPERYQTDAPQLMSAWTSLLGLPERLAELERWKSAEIDRLMKQKMPAAEREKRKDVLLADYRGKRGALTTEVDEYRNSFLFLATERLRENSDPWLLFFAAREYWEIKDAPAPDMEAIRQASRPTEKAVASPALELSIDDAADDVNQRLKMSGGAAREADVETAPAGTDAELPGATNLDRVIDAYRQILAKHPDFPATAWVCYNLALASRERGDIAGYHASLQRIVDRHPDFPALREVYFRLAEHHFATPSYEHYEKARGIYLELTARGSVRDVLYYRSLYKTAWSERLSTGFSEWAPQTFRRLYEEIKSLPEESRTPELNSMRREIVELFKQDDQVRVKGYQFFED